MQVFRFLQPETRDVPPATCGAGLKKAEHKHMLRLGREVGPERLEAACTRAVAHGACRYRSIKAILDTGLDRQSSTTNDSTELPDHDNVRGPQYYH